MESLQRYVSDEYKDKLQQEVDTCSWPIRWVAAALSLHIRSTARRVPEVLLDLVPCQSDDFQSCICVSKGGEQTGFSEAEVVCCQVPEPHPQAGERVRLRGVLADVCRAPGPRGR